MTRSGQADVRVERGDERFRGVRGAGLLLAVFLLFVSCRPDGPAGPVDEPDGFPVTLEWNAPTENAEGDPLEDLLGYRVHYRDTSPANGPGATTEDVDAADTRTTIRAVPTGTWFFGVTARDVAGNESALSNEVRVEVGQ
ncbi:MAG: hypothetical protein ACODAA_05465 [Gemmatimonadota bacterium]